MPRTDRVGHPGWFYRMLAPSERVRVLELGEAGLGAWFGEVERASRLDAPPASPPASYDLVVLHRTLGACGGLGAAAIAGAALLAPGGTLAITGDNAWRTATRAQVPAAPRGSVGAYRRAMHRAGLGDIAVFVALPPDADPEHVVQADAASARAFYRASLAGATRMPVVRRLAMRALVEANLMPRFARGFVAVGRRC